MRAISADYSQNLQQKVCFFHIYLSLIVSLSWCMLPFDVDLVFQYQRERFLRADFGKTIVLMTQHSHSQTAIFSVHFP